MLKPKALQLYRMDNSKGFVNPVNALNDTILRDKYQFQRSLACLEVPYRQPSSVSQLYAWESFVYDQHLKWFWLVLCTSIVFLWELNTLKITCVNLPTKLLADPEGIMHFWLNLKSPYLRALLVTVCVNSVFFEQHVGAKLLVGVKTSKK